MVSFIFLLLLSLHNLVRCIVRRVGRGRRRWRLPRRGAQAHPDRPQRAAAEQRWPVQVRIRIGQRNRGAGGRTRQEPGQQGPRDECGPRIVLVRRPPWCSSVGELHRR